MPFNDVCKELAPEVVAALKVLDASGFQIFTDVRIEDCVKPDGNRRRTFSNRGRYAVGALLKNLSSREDQELRAFPAETIKAEEIPSGVVVASEPEPAVESEPEPEQEPEPERKRSPGRPRGRR